MEKFFFFLIPLIVGWLFDKILGDPPKMPHLIVFFGKLISFGEYGLNRGSKRLLKGALMSIILICATFFITLFLICFCKKINFVIAVAVASILVFYCLAGTTLIHEVREVFRACERSLDEGRRQVARIVGRDTTTLSAQEVRTAALETLAENLNDGVIAPLFWYLLLGIPGMVTYKMINTLDSMIGYRSERYILFGRVAARIDDAANFIPARLTALLMLIVSGRLSLISFVMKYGKCHLSPNSGYPEAALAGILDCRFGGTHDYFGVPVEKPYIGTNSRELNIADMQCAVGIARRAEVVMIVIMLLVEYFILM